MSIAGNSLSRDFFELIKSIGEARSKQEEDRVIEREAITLKQRFGEPNTSPKTLKEYLIRSLYVEMLGHDASFSYIYAVKCAQSKDLTCKRVGYLVASLCLESHHELLLLLINTIQKDLKSSNYLEVAAALTCICKLLNEEMIPAVFPEILRLLQEHPHELIRRKCCMAIHAVFRLQPERVMNEAGSVLRKVLCDSEPGVMSASLHVIHQWSKQNRDFWMNIVPSLVSILKQIIDKRLSKDYDYHRFPAPWMQIQLLGLLATLGEGSQTATDEMIEVLIEVIRNAEIAGNVGYAIIYESVKTATTISPSPTLLNLAAASISKFIVASNRNLKYVGISGLASIVRVHPSFAALPEHQLVVVDCLEDTDDTLRRRTLDLLFRMTNRANIIVVVDKLLYHLRSSVDSEFQRDLASKIRHLADCYAPSHEWYVRIINEVLELSGGALLSSTTTYDLLRLLAEGPTGNDTTDTVFRREIVTGYVESLAAKHEALSKPLIQVACWMVGEYGPLNTSQNYSNLESLLDLLCTVFWKTSCSFGENDMTLLWILAAIMRLSILRLITFVTKKLEAKLVWPERHLRLTQSVILVLLYCLRECQGTYFEQRCLEFECLIMNPSPDMSFDKDKELLQEMYPFNASCEEIPIDLNLEFLNAYTEEQEKQGARPYLPLSQTTTTTSFSSTTLPQTGPCLTSSLNFTPYDKPSHVSLASDIAVSPKLTTKTTDNHSYADPPFEARQNTEMATFQVQGPRRWGPHGYTKVETALFEKNEAIMNNVDSILPIEQKYHKKNEINVTGTHLTISQQLERERLAKELFQGLTPVNIIIDNESCSHYSQLNDKLKQLDDGDKEIKMSLGNVSSKLKKTDEPLSHDLLSFNNDESQKQEKVLQNSDSSDFEMETQKTTSSIFELKPLNFTTQQVAESWGKLPHTLNRTIKISDTIKSCEQLFKELQAVLNIAIVQIINDEGIGAGELVESYQSHDTSTEFSNQVFVHAKITLKDQTTAFTLKGASLTSLNSLMEDCLRNFSVTN